MVVTSNSENHIIYLGWNDIVFGIFIFSIACLLLTREKTCLTYTKEGVLLRNVSPSLSLSDHFPGCGILNYRSDRDWLLRGCYSGGAL